MRMGIFALATLGLVACGGSGKDSTGTGTPSGTAGGTTGGTPGGTPGGTTGGTPTGTNSGTTVADCGNGVVDVGEACDPGDLGGETCESQGWDGGTLNCDSQCEFDYSYCTAQLNNAPGVCATPGQLNPEYGEEGHWMAARLTPPAWPFTVESVNYTSLFVPGQGCSPDFGHLVEVWADTALAPLGSPIVHEQFMVPDGTNSLASRDITWVLATPLTLQQDEHLYVSIQSAGGSPYVTCIETCQGGSVADRNYWSNAISAPFSWTTLDSFGIDATIAVTADGHP